MSLLAASQKSINPAALLEGNSSPSAPLATTASPSTPSHQRPPSLTALPQSRVAVRAHGGLLPPARHSGGTTSHPPPCRNVQGGGRWVVVGSMLMGVAWHHQPPLSLGAHSSWRMCSSRSASLASLAPLPWLASTSCARSLSLSSCSVGGGGGGTVVSRPPLEAETCSCAMERSAWPKRCPVAPPHPWPG